ncbi:hypothetical protein E2320_006801 [Naja naja]|nr:hypothetical protein E2320_006801 [Naja naja]
MPALRLARRAQSCFVTARLVSPQPGQAGAEPQGAGRGSGSAGRAFCPLPGASRARRVKDAE